MNKDERQKALDERSRLYYSLEWDLRCMKDKLQDLKKHRGNSTAFKVLNGAIDLMVDQVSKDFYRYKKRIRKADEKDDLQLLQQSLNREKIKNAKLEKEIADARTSSGLFISFVREKLGF